MNLRTILLALTCLTAGISAVAAEVNGRSAKLTGVAVIKGRSVALLEIPNPRGTSYIKPILEVGEKIGTIEVASIDATTGRVKVKDGNEETVLALPSVGATGVSRTLQLHSADSLQVFDVYQAMANRTVLRGDRLPGAKITLSTGDVPVEKALSALDDAFAERGIVIRQYGKKFIHAVGASDVGKLASIPALPGNSVKPQAEDVLPAGMVKFQGADHFQALEIYQELSGRTVLAPSNLRPVQFSVKSQTELSRDEALWMFDEVFRLSGVVVAPRGEKFVTVSAATEHAPLSGFKPNEVSAAVRGKGTLPPGMLKFQQADAAQVLSVYASLQDREVKGPVPSVRMSLKSQTELSCPEALEGLEALAALNHLKFELVGDKYVMAVLTSPNHPPTKLGPQ